MVTKKSEEDLYTEATGREPETRYPDDPDWSYRGRKEEKDALGKKLGVVDDDVTGVIEGQQELPL